MPDRLDDLGAIISHALRELRRVPPEYREIHARVLARHMVRVLGPTERSLMATASGMAAPDDFLMQLAWDDVPDVPEMEGENA